MSTRRRASARWYLSAALIGVPVAALLTSGCERDSRAAENTPAAEDRAPIPAVEAVQARQGTLPLVQRLTGTVRARGEVAIYPQTTGTIVEVLAENGEAVEKGQPLVRIQAVGSRAQVAQARSSLEVARAARAEAEANLAPLDAQYKRSESLAEEGLVPLDTVDTLRRQVEAARAAARRAAAEVRVGEGALDEQADVHRQTVVRAPIAGRVDAIRAQLADLALPPAFSVSYGGAYQEQEEARRDFIVAILLALGLVYMVMAGQFERFLDPLVVMFSVPVALVGVVPTLLLTGTTINVQSVMGMVMLIGIVVNNAIVLVDYINLKRREDGMNPHEAAIAAARTRLRPILMTTSTTVLGLLPLALGWGEGAGLQAALARVVVGGLLASTIVTLFLIPALYVSATAWADRARLAIAGAASRVPALRA